VRKAKLLKAILEQVTSEELVRAREKLRNRVVKLNVVFNLWKTPPTESDTRWIKDIDNLLKILFDVLGRGEQGLKLVEDDSYICQVQATKLLVPSKEEEGYRVTIEEYHDQQMLRSLNESFAKRRMLDSRF
jgi:Holliday junction resolvase RusA-like endonuclease